MQIFGTTIGHKNKNVKINYTNFVINIYTFIFHVVQRYYDFYMQTRDLLIRQINSNVKLYSFAFKSLVFQVHEQPQAEFSYF